MPVTRWELVITDVLHSLRSLLCTATNETPHDRVFKFPRKSTSGSSVPSWLLHSDKAFMKRHVRQSKYEPLVEEVDILDVNPSTSHIRTAEGREMTVSNRHLAPIGSSSPGVTLPNDSRSNAPIARSSSVKNAAETPQIAGENENHELINSESDHDSLANSSSDNIEIPFQENDPNNSDLEPSGSQTDFLRFSTRNRKQTEFYGV